MTNVFSRMGLFGCLMALAVFINPGFAQAQNVNNCAWPIELSPEGYGNATGPELLARYFLIPFDAQSESLVIKGAYPHARYFSYVVYQDQTPTAIIGDLYDAQIAPDPGSLNPYVRPKDKRSHTAHARPSQQPDDGTYTIVISHAKPSAGNTIGVAPGHFAWVMLRIYIPSADPTLSGHSLTGSVPLPAVSVTQEGASQPLSQCSPVNDLRDLGALLQHLFGGLVLNNPVDMPSSDRLWFAPLLSPPMRLFPNPHNKYVAMLPGDRYQPGRIIVIHGKAPSAPRTYDGSPIWRPAPGAKSVDVRYWALCSVNFELPITSVDCASDLTANLENGDYTVVISDDLLRPDWLPASVNWMRWGDEQYPKLLFFRNMLPAPDFPYSIQRAVEKGCTFDLTLPNVPNSDATIPAGQCAQQVMGDYYPVAAWCDKSTFVSGGWQACISGR